ncbi:hypothetical protein Elgi_31060 [Paenibacillus elgii]|nr:hypothetical protein Elgi_31060 [Paenibacillus elgii]
MRNDQLKPGYNVQSPYLEKVKAQLGKLLITVIADVGYGGEESYDYLEQNEVESIVKDSTYHHEKSKAWQKDISKIDNWTYNSEQGTWTCEAGQTLHFRKVSKEKTESGYEGIRRQ